MKENTYLYSVLTCITNNYEKIHEIENPNPNVEYIYAHAVTQTIIYSAKDTSMDIMQKPGCKQGANDNTKEK